MLATSNPRRSLVYVLLGFLPQLLGCQLDTKGIDASSSAVGGGDANDGSSVDGGGPAALASGGAAGLNEKDVVASGGTQDLELLTKATSVGSDSSETGSIGGAGGTSDETSGLGGVKSLGGLPSSIVASATGGTSSSSEMPATGGTSSSSSSETPATGGTPNTDLSACVLGATPCSAIPTFTGMQVVDGQGDEFCTVSGFELSFSNAVKIVEYNGALGASRYPERAVARIAWSEGYLHAFVRVTDPDIVPSESLDGIWNADGIDILITTSTPSRTVSSTGPDEAAMHLIVAPGAGTEQGRAAFVKTMGIYGVHSALPTEQFATIQDDAGFSVELRVPWVSGPVAKGSRVYFDFTLNSATNAVTGNSIRDALAILTLDTDHTTSACGRDYLPYCDEGTWCQTQLN